jgi:hypothetical protein
MIRLETIAHPIDRITGLFQACLNGIAQQGIVFHHQNPHTG